MGFYEGLGGSKVECFMCLKGGGAGGGGVEIMSGYMGV